MTQVKVPLCSECARKLRAILARDGEAAMARAIAGVLCETCRARVPVAGPLVSVLSEKGRPS